MGIISNALGFDIPAYIIQGIALAAFGAFLDRGGRWRGVGTRLPDLICIFLLRRLLDDLAVRGHQQLRQAGLELRHLGPVLSSDDCGVCLDALACLDAHSLWLAHQQAYIIFMGWRSDSMRTDVRDAKNSAAQSAKAGELGCFLEPTRSSRSS